MVGCSGGLVVGVQERMLLSSAFSKEMFTLHVCLDEQKPEIVKKLKNRTFHAFLINKTRYAEFAPRDKLLCLL